jgi:hypothetical protein
MMNKLPNPFKTALFSASGFFFRALLIMVIFLALHLSGLREYTGFISGTSGGNLADLLGMTYFVFYSLVVFVVPILLLASLFMAILDKFSGSDI